MLGFFPGVKQPRHVVNHSPPSSAEVKNEWKYTCPVLPPYAFMVSTGRSLLLLVFESAEQRYSKHETLILNLNIKREILIYISNFLFMPQNNVNKRVETSVMTFVFLLSPQDRVFIVDEMRFRFIEIWKHTE